MLQRLRHTILVRILLVYHRWIIRATNSDEAELYIYIQCYEHTLCFSCTLLIGDLEILYTKALAMLNQIN